MSDEEPPAWADTITRAASELARGLPIVGPPLATVIEDVRKRHRARTWETIEDVVGQVGDIETFAARLGANEELEVLFIGAIDAAEHSGLAAKRR